MTKKVRFPFFNPVTAVYEIPRGGRQQEPWYLNRVARQKALQKHGIPTSRRLLDLRFGNGSTDSRGSLGKYDSQMARLNLWHARKYGEAWYVPYKQGDKIMFYGRGQNARQRLLKEMEENYRAGRSAYSAFTVPKSEDLVKRSAQMLS
jgi:hypothetical protein